MSPESGPSKVTSLLRAWRGGDEQALASLSEVLYQEMRRLARKHMSGERAGHTLQTTALVNEAYIRLVDTDLSFEDRAHFMAMASRTMRRVLVDHARGRDAKKRGGELAKVTLHDGMVVAEQTPGILDLEAALEELEQLDARKVQVIELYYFGGLTQDEIAAAMKVAPPTVRADLRSAKAWLRARMSAG